MPWRKGAQESGRVEQAGQARWAEKGWWGRLAMDSYGKCHRLKTRLVVNRQGRHWRFNRCGRAYEFARVCVSLAPG